MKRLALWLGWPMALVVHQAYPRASLPSALNRLEHRFLMGLVALLIGAGALLFDTAQDMWAWQRRSVTKSVATPTKPAPRPMQRLPVMMDVQGIDQLFHLQPEPAPAPLQALRAHARVKKSPREMRVPPTIVMQHWSSPSSVMAPVYAQARTHWRKGQLAQARLGFSEVLHVEPHDVMALGGMAMISHQQHNVFEYEAYLSRLQQELPGTELEDIRAWLEAAE